MILSRTLRHHLITSTDAALASNEAYLDREIQKSHNSTQWINDCAKILIEVRGEIRRRIEKT